MMTSSSSSPEQPRASHAAGIAPVNGTAGAPVDSSTMIGIHIPDIVLMDTVVYYQLTVVTPAKAWSCAKRYSQFEELHAHLTSQFSSLSFPAGCQLPPKRPKMLVSHTDRQFIEERRILLEYYSRRMNTVAEVAASTTFKGFFASDTLEHLVHVPDDAHVFPPDAEITSVAIPYTRRMSDHILYHVELCNAHMRRSFSEWSVLKVSTAAAQTIAPTIPQPRHTALTRFPLSLLLSWQRFLQFHELDAALRAVHAHEPYFLSTLPSPPSRQLKMVIDHNDHHFVEQRRVLLEHYLKKMITVPQVAKSTAFLAFCGVST